MKQLQRQVDKLEDALRDATYDLAEQYRKSYVIPFCDRRGWRFTAGMGSWSFDDGTEDGWYGYWDESRMPKRLFSVLCKSVMCGQQSLGSCMTDYTPPNYKAKQ